MSKRAACYLRSSKDRADASIAAQERALHELAAARGLLIVESFADAVESGKDDDRPAFQKLLAAVRNRSRGWDTLLVLDTARIARRRLLALIFEEQECKKFGVTIVYKSLPEGDPLTDMLIKTVMQGFDEWHSLSSKAKGLAGMAENVKGGFRAGGSAPFGYRLVKVATGAVREGMPVNKSRLEVDAVDGPKIKDYLALRATGIARKTAAQRAGLALAVTSLLGIERNALTYAGHTVWNVGGEKGSGIKRRPRAEWLIQRSTHEALIDEAAAELLLDRLEAGKRDTSRRQRDSGALLGGLLVAPDGTPWHGSGAEYRLRPVRGQRARTVARRLIDEAVTEQLAVDLRSPALVRGLTARVQSSLRSMADDRPQREATKQLEHLSRRIASLVDMASEMSDRAPVLRKIDELEKERVLAAGELAKLEAEAAQSAGLAQVTEAQVANVLAKLATTLQDSDPEGMRAALEGLLEKVELDPETMTGRLHYRVDPSTGVKVASPRGAEPIPGLPRLALRAVLPFVVAGALGPRRSCARPP